jgi:hypothetical protein
MNNFLSIEYFHLIYCKCLFPRFGRIHLFVILIRSNPMKYFNKIFDIFLYQGIFTFLFSFVLLLVNDRYVNLFFSIGITSVIIAIVLGITGYFFNLFTKEDSYEES